MDQEESNRVLLNEIIKIGLLYTHIYNDKNHLKNEITTNVVNSILQTICNRDKYEYHFVMEIISQMVFKNMRCIDKISPKRKVLFNKIITILSGVEYKNKINWLFVYTIINKIVPTRKTIRDIRKIQKTIIY